MSKHQEHATNIGILSTNRLNYTTNIVIVVTNASNKIISHFVLVYNVERIRSRPTGGSEYTPSYFNKKKIRVTWLREFHEVVPPFERIHDNIRLHLKQRGVDERVLPEEERQICPTTSDEDDANSQAADFLRLQVKLAASFRCGAKFNSSTIVVTIVKVGHLYYSYVDRC